MKIHTKLMKSLNMEYPIIQAPLAGGGDTPNLVSAVCESGALGFIGAAYSTPEQIKELGQKVRKRTPRPFGINLFAPSVTIAVPDPSAAIEAVSPYFKELGLKVPREVPTQEFDFLEQLNATLETGARAFSFTFGILPPYAIDEIKQRGMFLIGTATTVDEGLTLEKAGVDAVVAQGSEAGGHRATFATDFDSGMIGTMALVPQLVDALNIPVIASGGIMDGRGIAASLSLGASAVQMGTAFLTCPEAGIPTVYKETILNANEDQTRITRSFSGRLARGIANRFMTEVDKTGAILPYPFQNALTRGLRKEAAKQGRPEFLSLWAGQGVRMARSQSAGSLVRTLMTETEQALSRLNLDTNETDNSE